VRYRELRATRLDLYMSYLQANHRMLHLMVRTQAEPTSVAPAVRAAVRATDPGLPVDDVIPMTRVVEEALGGPRFAARVFGAFAVVAALLAALGLYGRLAYSVTRRTREIGVRMALGARPVDVGRLVLREGMAVAWLGIAIGLAAALAGTRVLRALLYGVDPVDPLTFVAVSVLLASVALAACLLPIRRANGVNPVDALRAE
jgi:putative ABC transport system permease protein